MALEEEVKDYCEAVHLGTGGQGSLDGRVQPSTAGTQLVFSVSLVSYMP